MARNLLEILVVAVNAALVGVHTDQRGTAKNFEGGSYDDPVDDPVEN
jgi:hypothetical protein